ncbi:hypothetical protein SPSYN_02752 [Sporotomaculum syntrophicum]|uniref:Uncharacterized protein n=1 Tax=Sporotomaculum syntrophicum TaxID=182264 RepID=A0A9D3AVH0_9FIRM|nr:hypothetical protein [Sporotomaculum syntrophicum]KAF1084100.1 hypothetical protein SPSYN_02752 [Sporotomaculum syntrophicum]
MQKTSKSMLVMMGICIGMVFFNLNIALNNFNRLVSPEQPLTLLNWRTAEDKLEISLLGETLLISLDSSTWLTNAWCQKVGEQAGELFSFGREVITHRLDPVQQKTREIMGWQ